MQRSLALVVSLLFGASCGSPTHDAPTGGAGRAPTAPPDDAGTAGAAAGRPAATAGAATALVPGVWTNISPPAPLKSEELGGRPAGGVLCFAWDPADPMTLYTGIEHTGIWKTTDGGSSWEQLAPDADVDLYDAKTNQLEVPTGIAVDPADPSHLIAVSGVRDNNNGFWISQDGGRSWAIPQGFKDVSPTYDVTTLAVDPADFNHILVGSHAFYNVGVLESKDAGVTWSLHPPPADASWPGGTYGLSILHDPALGIGNGDTWLVHHDGFWLTKNAGATWSQVDAGIDGVHGSTEVYYSKTGTLYSGAGSSLARSNDNGTTWEAISQGLPNAPFITLTGDGNTLYTQPGLAQGTCQTLVSSETDGQTWTEYQDGTQWLPTGALRMRFEPTNRIIYSANGGAGFYALKVLDP